MKETSLYAKFKKKIKEAAPESFWYKIPDTGKLGGKKPFDGFLVLNGIPFAIEFKTKGCIPTKYQAIQLSLFEKAGGNSKVFTEGDDMDMNDFINTLIKEGGERQ